MAKEEIEMWKDFPRNKKFYHQYLRKIYTLFNQSSETDELRDIQLILTVVLDVMPHASSDYQVKILESKDQNTQSLIQDVWELTDYQSLLHSSGSGSSPNESQADKNSSYGEPILSSRDKDTKTIELDKDARHLRKYLFQNRKKFTNFLEDLKMFDADSRKNWKLVGDLATMFVADVVLILLSSQEKIKVSVGLVEALLKYSEFFSKSQSLHMDLPDEITIFDQLLQVTHF